MAAFDYLTQLFQGSEKMRGLSGGVGSAVALDDANSFYNFRLRRHYTDEEITDEPHRLWFTNDDPDARTGLGPHIAEILGEGQRFGDVLVVLADDNWDWCEDIDGFREVVHQMINDRFRAFLAEQGVAPPSRPLGLWMVRDRSDDIGGADFGLVDGEFITGLLPNLYRAPGADSKPVVTLHMNIPGAWDGYRQVGQLFDDQPLMTVGNHWLDNVRHDALREAALYRLQRDDEGGFFHIVNPDLQGRYQLHTTESDGTSVITLATREGEALAYLVLAVEDDAADAAPEPARAASSAPAPMAASAEATPDIAAPMMGDDFAIVDSGGVRAQPMASSVHRGRGGRTILPEAQTDRIFTLQERGVLFQKVHFHKFMLGYDVYVGTRGEVGTFVQPVSATFQIRASSVSLVADADNVAFNGQHLPKGESVLIDGDAVVEIGNQRLEYRDLSQIDAEGWPYVGEIRRPASSTYMLWGQQYAIGRSRDCRVVLPDDKHQDNIVWKPGVVEGAMIKSKKGDIPKSQFYTDSIMVSAEHAAIDLSLDAACLETKSSGAYSFIRRDGELLPVYPSRKEGPSQRDLIPGDEILIGNCLFHVGFAPAEDTVMPVAPAPRLSSDSLVDAMTYADAEPSVSLPPPGLPDPGDDDEPLTPRASASAMAGLDDDPAPPSGFHARPEPSVAPSPAVSSSTAQSRSRESTALHVPEPREAAPVAAPAPAVASGDVVVVREGEAKVELVRPARLVHIGWVISGSVDVGNHAGCEVVIPESQLDAAQTFAPAIYFSVKVRGRKATFTPGPAAHEVRVDGQVAFAGDVATRTLSVVRRDDEGEEDFTVDLTFAEDTALPDPRARLLSVDLDEPLAKALFVRGFPLRQPHRVALNGLEATGTFDGQRLALTGYLDTYRIGGGYRPVFVQAGGDRFVTAPEDGADIVLAAGDRIVVDGAVYRFETA